MFKGIYNVNFAGVPYSVLKVIPMLSKNRAHQSYLILNYGGFCEFFSQYDRNIHAKSVAVWKFHATDVVRITLLIFLKCCGAVITFPTGKFAKIFRMRA